MYETYAKLVLSTPLLAGLPGAPHLAAAPQPTTPVAGCLHLEEGEHLTRAEIEHLLSLVFFDVRLKRYLEIRPADSLPIGYALGYAALIRGLFYGPSALDALDGLLQVRDREGVEGVLQTLQATGWESVVEGRSVQELLQEVLDVASDGLEQLDTNDLRYLFPIKDLVARETTMFQMLANGGTMGKLAAAYAAKLK